MTVHLEAKKGDYADIVLLPGDPLRAKWIADTYLEEVNQVNGVRNCLGFTGYLNWNDKRILLSTQGGGMGMASNAIYIHELYNNYNVNTIIRVGSCGGISDDVNVGDIVAATTASTDSNMTKDLIPGYTFCPSVTYRLLEKFKKACPEAKVGGIVSSDWFYNPVKNWYEDHKKYGVLAVEMEAHILYALANKFGKDALAVSTVADHLEKPFKDMTSKERETSFNTMIESVFDTIC